MSLARTVSTGVRGLDLVMGGGVRLVQRLGDGRESATILVRGGAGAGKTLLGASLAAALAKEARTDVLFACVEILPTELRAQLDGILSVREVPFVSALTAEATPDAAPRFDAALLPLEEHAGERDALVQCLLDALDQSARRGLRPGVLVVDSLSDGYGFGANVDRVIADGVCKLAIERGLVLILLEESPDLRASPWNFAVDTVLELTRREATAPAHDRLLSVSKHRFARSDLGPHALVLWWTGLSVLPRPSAYLNVRPEDLISQAFVKKHSIPRRWLPNELRDWNEIKVVAVVGEVAADVRMTAGSLDILEGFYLHIRLGNLPPTTEGRLGEGHETICVDALTTSPEGVLAVLVELLKWSKVQVTHVLIGDWRSLSSLRESAGVLDALQVAIRLLVDCRIPVILYETIGQKPGQGVSLSENYADGRIDLHVGGAAYAYSRRVDRAVQMLGLKRGTGTGTKLD